MTERGRRSWHNAIIVSSSLFWVKKETVTDNRLGLDAAVGKKDICSSHVLVFAEKGVQLASIFKR